MNYSRNIRRASIGKRILISWVVIAISFFLMGFGIGAIGARGVSKEIQNSECPAIRASDVETRGRYEV